MNFFKSIVYLIIATIIYFIVGLIAWNIVCSWVDISSCTLVEISNYRIYTYSGIALISAIIAEIRAGIKNGRDMMEHVRFCLSLDFLHLWLIIGKVCGIVSLLS